MFARRAFAAAIRFVAVILWMSFGGCRASAPRAPTVTEWTPARRAALYERTDDWFPSADFWKPPEDGVEGVPEGMFPLIVEACPDVGSGVTSFGRVVESLDGACGVDLLRPTVYAAASTMVRDGVVHEQQLFMWFYAADDASPSAGIRASGLRVTMNPEGSPMVWEVISRNDDGAMVFVAQSLEDAAADEFGVPLPGRRFSIEGDVSAAPDAVVARVLADGPVPMGPFVYLDAGRRVSTVICRCMPSQADSFRETANYEIESLQALPTCAIEFLPAWFGDVESHKASPLERALRWPKG
ncbi:MAG: hypothetical protein HOP29_19275 [Phycisphaerales bacterium]|nr:hypothetical protein [Phycisphaerales bacterium]